MPARKLLLIISVFALALAACGSGESAPTGSADEIAQKVFAEAGVEPFGPTASLESDEDLEFYLGSTNYPEFTDTAVVLPLINLDTRALYILKVETADEAEEVLAQLEEDVDPNKLICVSFALEDVIDDSRDYVVFMTINSDHDQRDALAEAFQAID